MMVVFLYIRVIQVLNVNIISCYIILKGVYISLLYLLFEYKCIVDHDVLL